MDISGEPLFCVPHVAKSKFRVDGKCNYATLLDGRGKVEYL